MPAFTARTSVTSKCALAFDVRPVPDPSSTNRGRTPKWALKAGLVNSDDRDRRARKNQWAKRFDERNAYSAHVGQSLEEGEEGENYVPVSEAEREREMRREREGLWRENEDTEYYNEGRLRFFLQGAIADTSDQAPNQRNWHYPANFEGAASGTGTRKFGKKNKGDRWERSVSVLALSVSVWVLNTARLAVRLDLVRIDLPARRVCGRRCARMGQGLRGEETVFQEQAQDQSQQPPSERQWLWQWVWKRGRVRG